MISTLDRSDESDRYRLLVDAISDYAIYMLDAGGHVASWNPGAERFKGYKADEIIGQHFSRFYTPEDMAIGLPERALRTAATEGRFENEGWRLRKDGTRFWAHVVIDPIIAPDGEVIGYAKVTRDLTERRRAEDELRLSEQRFRLPRAGRHRLRDLHARPAGFGDQLELGRRADQGLQARRDHRPALLDILHRAGSGARACRSRTSRSARSAGRFEKEGIRVRKDGTRFWANVVIDAIHDENGELIGFAKVTRDITERKRRRAGAGAGQ